MKLTLNLTAREYDLIAKAQKTMGARHLETFARLTLLQRAAEIAREAAETASRFEESRPEAQSTLHAYIGSALPADAEHPATLFPTMRGFATIFSDSVRQMLRTLAEKPPGNVKNLRRLIPSYGTNEKLYSDISRLKKHGLVAQLSSRDGREAPPVLRYARLKLHINLTDESPQRIMRLALRSAPDETGPYRVSVYGTFRSMKELASALTDGNLEYLRLIATGQPQSITELAALCGRTPAAVHHPIRKLVRAGLLRVEGRQPTRPVLTYDAIELELIFTPHGHGASSPLVSSLKCNI